MTENQWRMASALKKCTFLPGSSPKRFVLGLAQETELTEAMDWFLRRLYYSYRRQIGHKEPKPADFDLHPKNRTRRQVEELEKLERWNHANLHTEAK